MVLAFDLNRGDIVDFSWSANGSVTFRIENLAGTIVFVDRTGQTGSGNWEVSNDGSYVFELRNPNDFFSVTVQWAVDLRPLIPLTLVYFLVALALMGVAMVAFLTLRKKQPK